MNAHIDARACTRLWVSVLALHIADATGTAKTRAKERQVARAWLLTDAAGRVASLAGYDPEVFFDAMCRLAEAGWSGAKATTRV